MHSELYLYHFEQQYEIRKLDIKKEEKMTVNELEFVFRIIGDSHYIECEELGFYELLSCKPTNEENNVVVELSKTSNSTVTDTVTETGANVTTILRGEPLSVFDETNNHDMVYRFGENAYTTISYTVTDENITFCTYHTYPEFDVAFFSETTITPENETELIS